MRIRAAFPALIAVALTSLWLQAQVRDFRPVTEAMLRNPAPGDWLNWRRTDNAWGYSPLDQINRQNAGQLQLAWSWAMDDTGAQEATPLVYNGIMYLPNPRGVIQALDAATGDLIWEYRPEAAQPRAAARRRPRRRRRADRHPAPFSAAGCRGSRRRRRYGTRDSEKPRDLRRQDLRHHERRARRRPRRANREGRLGHHGRGFEAGIRLYVRSDRRSRKGDCGNHRMQPLQGRRLLHHRARRGDRQRVVAHVHHCSPGRARRRDMGRSAAQVPRRQRRVDPRQLRSRGQPRLLGHRASQAVGQSRSRHRWIRALHELDARARSRHGKDEVVLPAPARRNAGHGRSLRKHPDRYRRTQVAVQDGQARDSLAARSNDRRVRPRDGSRVSDDPRCEPADRQGHLPARQDSGNRRAD